ncbi:MAG TPA: D-alanyl-D-alanine carboxypeptidase [Thermomicrobiales bacterium]|jgi:D-alanyl-D-alanine carboxypeptidase (penicillin-binding protein 5/6)
MWAGQRARGLRLSALYLLLLAALPGLMGFTVPRTANEPGLLPAGPEATPFTLSDLALLRSQPAPPAIGARSAIVWDATAGVELFSKAPDERIPPASTTKMLTALIGIDVLKLDTRIAVDKRDISLPEYEESTMQLIAGDVVTFEDLLYGMLLVSGGDAARTTARAAGTILLAGTPGDPVARFMQEMNDRVAKMGLQNTHFINPHGDDAPGHYSSARDLLRIADEALKRPDFARIVETKTATRQTVDGQHVFALKNTNDLLFARAGIHGVKTGTTEGCGQCLVAAQWGPGGRIISVVLGATDRSADTTILLDWTNASYRWFTLGQGGDLAGLNAALARWGVTFHDRRVIVLQAWEAPSLRYRLLLERGLGKPGEPRGEVVFLTTTREVLRLPVYAAERTDNRTPATPTAP